MSTHGDIYTKEVACARWLVKQISPTAEKTKESFVIYNDVSCRRMVTSADFLFVERKNCRHFVKKLKLMFGSSKVAKPLRSNINKESCKTIS